MQMEHTLDAPLLNKQSEFNLSKTDLKSIFDCYCQRQEKTDQDTKRGSSGQVVISAKDQEKERQLTVLNKYGGAKTIVGSLKSDLQNGLNSKDQRDMDKRRLLFGENKKKDIPPVSILQLIIEQFEDEILRLLLLAATVSLAIGIWKEGLGKGWYEGVTIYFAILIIVSVTAMNDYVKDKQFRKLNDVRKERYILARRNGHTQSISTFDIVVGDIIELKQGDLVPADCLLIESDDLQTDESSITGESEHIKKFPQNGSLEQEELKRKKYMPNPFLLQQQFNIQLHLIYHK